MELGVPKIAYIWNIILFKNRKVDSIWYSSQWCQKYALYPKIILQIKVVEHWIPYKKVSEEHTSISLQSGTMGLCMEFNASRLLFEAFFHITRIFGSVESQTESTFPFQYNIIFKKFQPLGPLSSTLEGGRHVHSLTFLYRIQWSTTFIGTIFAYNAYFWQRWVPKWIYFPIFLHYNTYFKHISFLNPPAPLSGEVVICASWLFCREFNSK